jgi:hypothetical protein
MRDKMILHLACQHLSITEERVMSWRVYDNHIALVIWPGPKHKILLSELREADTPKRRERPIPVHVLPSMTVAARELAHRHGLDVSGTIGTGKNGRILKRDQQIIDGG